MDMKTTREPTHDAKKRDVPPIEERSSSPCELSILGTAYLVATLPGNVVLMNAFAVT